MNENETQLRKEKKYLKKRSNLIEFFSARKELLFVLVLSVISSSIQIYFALKTWGMITSDEVSQSIEIAHRIVYGYGYICPEFSVINIPHPHFARCRSVIYPLFFVIPMYVGKILNLNYWSFTIPFFRVMIGINGALITPSSYYFIKKYTKNKQNYAALTAILVTFSPFISLMGFRSVTNIALIPWIFLILAAYYKILENFSNQVKEYVKIIILTIFMSIILYIRLDLILTLALVLVFKFPHKNLKIIASHAIGLVIGLSLGILADSLYYKIFTISPLNWFLFNFVDDGAVLFGVAPFSYYFKIIFELKAVIVSIVLTLVVFFILVLRIVWQIIKKKELKLDSTKALSIFLFASFFIVLTYSFAKHKEFRLIYSGYVYFHFSIAIAVAILIEEFIPELSKSTVLVIKKLQTKKERNFRALNLFYTGLIFSLIFSGALIATIKGTEIVNWKEGDEITRGLVYVGQQNDSIGVMVVLRYFIGEMYSYLHKDIPIKDFKDIENYEIIDSLIRHIEEEYEMYNYVILPFYQIQETPILVTILYASNFTLVHTIDNSANIYRYNGTL